MKVYERYPKLSERLGDADVQLRHLLTIDENVYDYDAEEFEFDPQEYNYIVYIADPLRKLLGEDGLAQLARFLQTHASVEDFIVSEEDLFALKTAQDEGVLSDIILTFAQDRL